jgi:hypothetical protein
MLLLLLLTFTAHAFAPCDTAKQCLDAAKAMGLKIGHSQYAGYTFVGNYGTEGCYYYKSGEYRNMAFFGTFPGSHPNPELQSGQTRIEVDWCSNGCDPKENCERAAKAKGLSLGGNGYNFVGEYGTQGCYYYTSGSYKNMAFFGVYPDDTPSTQRLKSYGIKRLNSDCREGNSYGEWLHHMYGYSTRGCLDNPWKHVGENIPEKSCAKLCYYDSKCLTFTTSDKWGGDCYISYSHGLSSCGMFSSTEYYYVMHQRHIFRFMVEDSAMMTMIEEDTSFTLTDAAVYGFAAVGALAIFAGIHRIYKGGKQQSPVEMDEI